MRAKLNCVAHPDPFASWNPDGRPNAAAKKFHQHPVSVGCCPSIPVQAAATAFLRMKQVSVPIDAS